MGAVISVILDLIELISVTGFEAESIISGEAAAIVESQLSSLAVIENASAAEVLSTFGLNETSYSLLVNFPQAFENAVYTAQLIQTVSGASSLIAAGIETQPFQIFDAGSNMALQQWRPDYIELFIPGYRHFEYYFNVLSGWGESLVNTVSRAFWEALLSETRQTARLLASSAVDNVYNVGEQGLQNIQNALVGLIEGARWALRFPGNVYHNLEMYYAQLPGLTPPQVRSIQKRLEEARNYGPSVQVDDSENSVFSEHLSGDYIFRGEAPGGARQRQTPDWMLQLILGILGDITPFFKEVIEEVEGEENAD